MGKKKGGKSKGFTSNGERTNVSKKLRNQARSEYLNSPNRPMNQLKAYRSGKRVMVTIENPNKNETNKRFIRISAATLWRDPKNISRFSM